MAEEKVKYCCLVCGQRENDQEILTKFQTTKGNNVIFYVFCVFCLDQVKDILNGKTSNNISTT